jgi:CTP:molybdopterin cytidylyltransferase MocA
MQVAAVILAAGASRRFGTPKQLARINGQTMLELLARAADDAGLDPIIAVVPPGIAVPPSVVPKINDDPGAGISRSIRLGLGALPKEVEAAVVLLGDEPMIRPGTIRSVLGAADGSSIVAARFADRIGPPVLIPRTRLGVVDAIDRDEGLGRLLRTLPDVRTIELAAAPIDIDTPADLGRIRS